LKLVELISEKFLEKIGQNSKTPKKRKKKING
jgi:hypothetical protein